MLLYSSLSSSSYHQRAFTLVIIIIVVTLLLLSSSSSSPTIIVNAQQLTVHHYKQSTDCTGPASTSSFGLDSCIFGAGGKSSSQYFCNSTHAKMFVYLKSSSCERVPNQDDLIKTESELDTCHKIISTSMKFVCGAELVGGRMLVMILALLLCSIL